MKEETQEEQQIAIVSKLFNIVDILIPKQYLELGHLTHKKGLGFLVAFKILVLPVKN